MRKIFLYFIFTIYAFGATITLDNYFDKNGSIMLLIDPSNGSIVRANNSAAKFYGYSSQKLSQMKIQDINTFTKEQVVQEMKRAKEENRNYFIFRHRLSSGEIKRVEVYSHPIVYEGKKVLYSTIHDVSNLELAQETIDHYSKVLEKEVDKKSQELIESEKNLRNMLVLGLIVQFFIILVLLYTMKKRRETQNKLKESQDELQEIINSFPIPIISADAKTHNLNFFNNSFKKLFGWEHEDIDTINKWFDKAYPDEKYRSHLKEKWEALINETHELGLNTSKRSVPVDVTCKDGTKRNCHIWYHHNENNIFGIFYDITKQLELEHENLEQQKMMLTQSKIAAVGEMLGNIAHQWRQPLSVITSQVSGLKVAIEFQDEVKEEQILECVDDVMNQANYLSQTINDFKNFFSADNETIQDFNLKETMIKTKALVKDSLENNYINVITNLEDVIIEENENQLIQSLLNICNNAKDAMVLNEIDHDDRFMFVNVSKDKTHAIISFKDSGGGVDEEFIDKIFEPYFTTKHQSMGTGIGLYMTYQMITNNFKGSIEVENCDYEHEGKQLKGAEFTIKIPFIKSIKK